MFGLEALREALSASKSPDDVVTRVVSAVAAFRDGATPNDDVTLFCYRHQGALPAVSARQAVEPAPSASAPLSCHFALGPEALAHPDCLPQVLSMLRAHPSVTRHFGRVATVLTELFNNALEHGLLCLPSELKDAPDGLMGFWEERQRRLAAITAKDAIDIDVTVRESGEVTLAVTDSGAGFSYPVCGAESVLEMDSVLETDSHGRGLRIVLSLVSRLAFEGAGNRVVATLAPARSITKTPAG